MISIVLWLAAAGACAIAAGGSGLLAFSLWTVYSKNYTNLSSRQRRMARFGGWGSLLMVPVLGAGAILMLWFGYRAWIGLS